VIASSLACVLRLSAHLTPLIELAASKGVVLVVALASRFFLRQEVPNSEALYDTALPPTMPFPARPPQPFVQFLARLHATYQQDDDFSNPFFFPYLLRDTRWVRAELAVHGAFVGMGKVGWGGGSLCPGRPRCPCSRVLSFPFA